MRCVQCTDNVVGEWATALVITPLAAFLVLYGAVRLRRRLRRQQKEEEERREEEDGSSKNSKLMKALEKFAKFKMQRGHLNEVPAPTLHSHA